MAKLNEIKIDGAFLQMSAKFDFCAALSRMAACVPTKPVEVISYMDMVEPILPVIEKQLAAAREMFSKTRELAGLLEKNDMEAARKMAEEMGLVP